MAQEPILQDMEERQIRPEFWETCGAALLAAATEIGVLDAAAYPMAAGKLIKRLRSMQAEGNCL